MLDYIFWQAVFALLTITMSMAVCANAAFGIVDVIQKREAGRKKESWFVMAKTITYITMYISIGGFLIFRVGNKVEELKREKLNSTEQTPAENTPPPEPTESTAPLIDWDAMVSLTR